MWKNLVNGADCIMLPPKGRPVAAPRETSPAFDTLGYSEAGHLSALLQFKDSIGMDTIIAPLAMFAAVLCSSCVSGPQMPNNADVPEKTLTKDSYLEVRV